MNEEGGSELVSLCLSLNTHDVHLLSDPVDLRAVVEVSKVLLYPTQAGGLVIVQCSIECLGKRTD